MAKGNPFHQNSCGKPLLLLCILVTMDNFKPNTLHVASHAVDGCPSGSPTDHLLTLLPMKIPPGHAKLALSTEYEDKRRASRSGSTHVHQRGACIARSKRARGVQRIVQDVNVWNVYSIGLASVAPPNPPRSHLRVLNTGIFGTRLSRARLCNSQIRTMAMGGIQF